MCWMGKWFLFFLFQVGNILLGNFGPETQNCLFKMKFVTQNNLNTLNSMMKFFFSLFHWEKRFTGNTLYQITRKRKTVLFEIQMLINNRLLAYIYPTNLETFLTSNLSRNMCCSCFFLLNGIAHFLWESSFALALF